MSLKEGLLHLQERFARAQSIVSPRRLETQFNVPVHALENECIQEFADMTLWRFKYRQGVLNLLWNAPERLSEQERLGVVLYVGLVSRIDDILDSDILPVFGDKSHMQDYILNHPAMPYRQRGVSIEQIRDGVLRQFPSCDKKELVLQFMDYALEAQWEAGKKLSCHGYSEALQYRDDTTGLYVKVGGALADLSTEQINKLYRGSMLWQRLDDAADLSDLGVTPNLYIGLAREIGEIGVIERAKKQGILDEALPFIQKQHYTKLVVCETPVTRAAYRALFDREYAAYGDRTLPLSKVRDLVL